MGDTLATALIRRGTLKRGRRYPSIAGRRHDIINYHREAAVFSRLKKRDFIALIDSFASLPALRAAFAAYRQCLALDETAMSVAGDGDMSTALSLRRRQKYRRYVTHIGHDDSSRCYRACPYTSPALTIFARARASASYYLPPPKTASALPPPMRSPSGRRAPAALLHVECPASLESRPPHSR